MNRIVLGTVQLGVPYGAMVAEGVMPLGRAEEILDRAWDLGIRAFDTAEAYGCAARRLSDWLERRSRMHDAEITTKVLSDHISESGLSRALSRFDGASRKTILSHGFVSRAHWDMLADVAQTLGAEPGQSVYEPDEVRDAAGFPRTARLQAPGNIFDRRALDARNGSPVALDLRSLYLQGVLLLSAEEASRRVEGGGSLAEAVRSAASLAGKGPAELCMASMLSTLGPSDRLVIGADAPSQLAPIAPALALANHGKQELQVFMSEVRRRVPHPPSRLLDPRQWPA